MNLNPPTLKFCEHPEGDNMFKLNDRVVSVWNGQKEEGDYSTGTVVVVVENGNTVYQEGLDKEDNDLDMVMSFFFDGDSQDVVIKFDDGHYEWGYYGDGDLILLEE